jgi:hypothetical protein
MRALSTPAWVSSVLFCLLFLGSFVAPAARGADVWINVDYDASHVNSGDNAWMLTSSALVLLMTGPGLALFYSGLVRRKNVLGTMMQSFMMMAVVTVVWALVAYSLAFDYGSPVIGDLRRVCRADEVQRDARVYDLVAAGRLLPDGSHGLGKGWVV